MGTGKRPFYYQGKDELLSLNQDFGQGINEPGDFLQAFNQYVKILINDHAALTVVCSRPSDLTREQLHEVRSLLDNQGYSEVKLKTAWHNKINQDMVRESLW